MDSPSASQNSKGAAGQDGHHYQDVLSPPDLLRKLFEDQSGDWEMISTDGKVFKFHKNILEAQVPYFRAFFLEEESKECGNHVSVPDELDMCGESAEAFLRYVYYKDCTAMDKSCSITFALIQAGRYFDIPSLVEVACQKIQERGASAAEDLEEWFDMIELWELYQQVSRWEKENPKNAKLMENISIILKMHNGDTTIPKGCARKS